MMCNKIKHCIGSNLITQPEQTKIDTILWINRRSLFIQLPQIHCLYVFWYTKTKCSNMLLYKQILPFSFARQRTSRFRRHTGLYVYRSNSHDSWVIDSFTDLFTQQYTWSKQLLPFGFECQYKVRKPTYNIYYIIECLFLYNKITTGHIWKIAWLLIMSSLYKYVSINE